MLHFSIFNMECSPPEIPLSPESNISQDSISISLPEKSIQSFPVARNVEFFNFPVQKSASKPSE